MHEASSKFADNRRRLALRVDVDDFKAVSREDISNVAPSVLFRGPNYNELRYQAFTRKLSVNTGIPEHSLRILDMNISSVNFDIAWNQRFF